MERLTGIHAVREALEAIRSELNAIGLPSMSVSDVLGSGRQAGIVEHYRGASKQRTIVTC